MKVNNKLLSIPPYISTTWDHVDYLKIEERAGAKVLVVGLNHGNPIEILNLDDSSIEEIFRCHANALESHEIIKEAKEEPAPSTPTNQQTLPFGLGISPMNLGLDGLGDFSAMLEHNPEQADAPALPSEVLSKVSGIAKLFGLSEDSFNIPDGQPHCNCHYCQIAKAIHHPDHENAKPSEETSDPVTEDDLRFRDWEISQKDDQLYEVIHPLDKSERYQVYLGNPLGCTCGRNDCEHIRAVLSS